jgi:hypothetical protein
MKKIVSGSNAIYRIAWSPVHKYEKYEAMKIVTELPGIICLMQKMRKTEILIFYSCWRDGCRGGLKKFMDPDVTPFPEILDTISKSDIYYKYTVVEGNIADMKDVMHGLIYLYEPVYNNDRFKDSGRYRQIKLIETERSKDSVIEKFSHYQPIP